MQRSDWDAESAPANRYLTPELYKFNQIIYPYYINLIYGINVRTTWFAEWRFTSVQLIHLDDFRTSCLYLLHFFGFSEFMTESTIGPTWIPGDFVRSPGDREVRFQTGRLPVKPGDLASLPTIQVAENIPWFKILFSYPGFQWMSTAWQSINFKNKVCYSFTWVLSLKNRCVYFIPSVTIIYP
jgi:hypothetical protein